MSEEKIYIEGIGEAELSLGRRRTLSIEIRPDGAVRIHAPRRYPKRLILEFVQRKKDWILQHRREMEERSAVIRRGSQRLFADRIEAVGSGKKLLEKIRKKTREEVEKRASFYAGRLGVSYDRITIRAMTSRWGSCSSQGHLSFHVLLSELPEEVMDYVIIHELCHRLEMNHSARFWALVAREDPDYKAHRSFLRLSGPVYIAALEDLKG